MSFLGAIGYIMGGSGLKELLSTCYASGSLDRMLGGHAYARSIRAHMLVHSALGSLIIGETELTADEESAVTATIDAWSADTLSYVNLVNDKAVQSGTTKFYRKMQEIEQRGATAALWIHYYKLVTIIKNFIMAERMSNWDLHLDCVAKMLPFFHASSHFPNAKSAQLYLQDVVNLQSFMSEEEARKFKEGYFTVRRSKKLWCGVWTDMCIEQTYMREMKS